MYFSNCTTPAEIKTRYRELAFEHHPDRGGDTRTMQDINNTYHEALQRANGYTHHDTGKDFTYRYEYEREQAIIDKIGALLKLKMEDVEIWLIGLWIWVIGDTRPHKEELKALKCCWHSKRKCWYWKPYEDRSFYSKKSLGNLAARYGAKKFEQEPEPKPNPIPA
jgi:hypothetical protein